tara:strand:- start:1384 stop:2016 length:633 start_codon:yes stop_codon:yes gene_type:complete
MSELDKYKILEQFNVSRETYHILDDLKKEILLKNSKINLISKNTESNFIERHTIDCAQVIDFIDLNQKKCTDIGSGAGLPGLVIAIILKSKNLNMKVDLYEKSYHKGEFLKYLSKKLKLNVEVFQKDIFKEKNLNSGTLFCRAFKPLPIILELVEKNFKDYSNLVVFMGKSGKQILESTTKKWDLEYKKTKSITNEDSFLINFRKIKKND